MIERTRRQWFRGHWLRLSLGALVLGFVAMPAARVYMYDEPLIAKINLLGNNDEVGTISGHGLPNSMVQVWYRQRNFHQGDRDGNGSAFGWCGDYNTGWIHAGKALTDENGTWIMDVGAKDIVVINPGVWVNQDRAPCAAGLNTEFRTMHTLNSSPSVITTSHQVPILHWFKIKKNANGDQTGNAQAVVRNAWNSAITIADGPNDADSPNGKTIDVNSSGYDCEVEGAGPCPREIRFTTSGATRPAPSISVIQENVFPSDLDAEFVSLLGAVVAHSPGGSILASGKRDRPNVMNAATIRIIISGLSELCDPSELFNFF